MSDERQLTPTARLHEVTMQALHRSPRQPEANVELSLNAKGDVQVSVSVQGLGTDVGSVGLAAEAEFDRLLAKYPRPIIDPDNELAKARKAAAIQANRAKVAQARS